MEAGIGGFPLELIFDPQSSGGLLIALKEDDMGAFSREAAGSSLDYWVIGHFTEQPREREDPPPMMGVVNIFGCLPYRLSATMERVHKNRLSKEGV